MGVLGLAADEASVEGVKRNVEVVLLMKLGDYQYSEECVFKNRLEIINL